MSAGIRQLAQTQGSQEGQYAKKRYDRSLSLTVDKKCGLYNTENASCMKRASVNLISLVVITPKFYPQVNASGAVFYNST